MKNSQLIKMMVMEIRCKLEMIETLCTDHLPDEKLALKTEIENARLAMIKIIMMAS